MIWPLVVSLGSALYHYTCAVLRLSNLVGLCMLGLVLLAQVPYPLVPKRIIYPDDGSRVTVQRQVDQAAGRVTSLEKRMDDLEALQIGTSLARLQQSLDDQRYLVFGIGVVVLLNGLEKLFSFLTPVSNRKRGSERRQPVTEEEEV